ncbi:MAG: PD-(D/E)XK nuclease family protein [Phycisphaerales bacterium JB063]
MGDYGDPQRAFLGWAGPALPAAARWLLSHPAQPTPGDLSGLLVAVPGGRAQRRLVELLAQLAVERGVALVPPTVVTVGALADRLMPPNAATQPGIADRCTALLVRASALRDADGALLSTLTPAPPGRDDWPGWWALAGQLETLAAELGTVGMTPEQAAQCDALTGDERWAAVGTLDRRYHEALAGLGLVDAHAARRDAAGDANAAAQVPHVVLVATPDLRPIHTQLLGRYAQRVDALIFAPSEHAGGFDAWGVLRPGYWLSRSLPTADDAIAFVSEPGDQAEAVLDALARWSRDGALSADSVTVGLGDASLAGIVERTLELSGVPARSVNGRPVSRSRPVLLLEALGEYAGALRFDRLASLLRHPDALTYASHAAREAGAVLDHQDGGWLGLLDRYASAHLQGEVTGHWLGDSAQREALGAIYGAVQALLPEGSSSVRRPLTQWARPIGEALARVYGETALSRHRPEDRPVVLGLEAIGNLIETIGTLQDGAAYIPSTTFTQAVRFVLGQVDATPVPEPGGSPAVELVGVLELALDDAPRVVVVGVNEGAVPEPIAEHPMLPRQVREALGLHDDDHRLAREQLMLTSVVSSRAHGDCLLVAGRVSPSGDPLMPSRLLLRGSDATLSRRVAWFFEEAHDTPPRPALLTPGRHDRFLIPTPMLDEPALTQLSVTAFRDYLACPYRFYLKHVRKLRLLDDRAVELDGGAFGSLAHAALRVLGEDALQGEDRPDKIYDRLSAALDQGLREQYGPHPRAAVRVQAEQLRYRLEAAARVQALHAAQGWRVTHVEGAGRSGRLSQTIEVDGEPFTLTGKIDRIDRHEDGRYLVIDYKTSNRAKSPESTHRAGPKNDKRWTDLQLPLYRGLCAELGVTGDRVELAYFNVPKTLSDAALSIAVWDEAEIAEALAMRDEVIRALRLRLYWPPSEQLPGFEDGLAGLCADEAEDRARIVQRSGGGSGAGDG